MVKKITLAVVTALSISLPGVQAHFGTQLVSRTTKRVGKAFSTTSRARKAVEAVLGDGDKEVQLVAKKLQTQFVKTSSAESKLRKAYRYVRNLTVPAAIGADQYFNDGQYTQKSYDLASSSYNDMVNRLSTAKDAIVNLDYAATGAAVNDFIANHGGSSVATFVAAHPISVAGAVAALPIAYAAYKLAPKVKTATKAVGRGLVKVGTPIVNNKVTNNFVTQTVAHGIQTGAIATIGGTVKAAKNTVNNRVTKAVARGIKTGTIAAIGGTVKAATNTVNNKVTNNFVTKAIARGIKAGAIACVNNRVTNNAYTQAAGRNAKALGKAAYANRPSKTTAAITIGQLALAGVPGFVAGKAVMTAYKLVKYGLAKVIPAWIKEYKIVKGLNYTAQAAIGLYMFYALCPALVNRCLAQVGSSMPTVITMIPETVFNQVQAHIPEYLHKGLIDRGFDYMTTDVAAVEAADMCHIANAMCEVNGVEAAGEIARLAAVETAYNNLSFYQKPFAAIFGC